ncbi:MAG: hypothetical protein ABDI20_00290 [Candidatus Bipolaricaulaceae bacterium]
MKVRIRRGSFLIALAMSVGVILFSLHTLAGESFPLAELEKGRWALAFVVLPGCPACEVIIPWVHAAKGSFLEIHFALVAPYATLELKKQAEGLRVFLDEGGRFGFLLGVRRAPTVVFFVEGIPVEKLEWPFTEEIFFQKLGESLRVVVPSPKELVGQPAPDFAAQNLEGSAVKFRDLPKPLLIAFLALGCVPCWEALPVLTALSRKLPVVLVALVGHPGLAENDRQRLIQFAEKAKTVGGQTLVLLDHGMEGFPVAMAYRIRRSPTFILVDGKGVVGGVWETIEGLESVFLRNNT